MCCTAKIDDASKRPKIKNCIGYSTLAMRGASAVKSLLEKLINPKAVAEKSTGKMLL